MCRTLQGITRTWAFIPRGLGSCGKACTKELLEETDWYKLLMTQNTWVPGVNKPYIEKEYKTDTVYVLHHLKYLLFGLQYKSS